MDAALDPVTIATAMTRPSLEGANPPPVAVAIVSWNTRELLQECLESWAGAVEAGQAEVWVVDNASRDGSVEMVRERFPWARALALEHNLGFGAAVNLVAGETATPWIVVANADTALRPGALASLMRAGAQHPSAGIIAPRLVLPSGEVQHSAYAFPTLPFTLAFNLGAGSVSRRLADRLLLIGAWDSDRSRWVDWAIGAFLLVRRAAWEEIGGFDEALWMYAEDLDLGWRAAAAGWRTWFESSASIRHEGAAATSQVWADERDARWQRSTYAWLLRRRGLGVTRAIALINTLGALTRLAIVMACGWTGDQGRAARRQALRRWTRLHGENLFASRGTLEAHR